MTKPNPANERTKREYYGYLKEARGLDEVTIDAVAKSIARFEESTKRKEFRRFHREQAVAFKRGLSEALNARTGEPLSKSTVLSTLRDLRAFFFWLALVPGFKSHIAYVDADYFSPNEKDAAVARAVRDKKVPTLAQVEHVLSLMPGDTSLQRRDRAVIAFAMITCARVTALASLRLAHVNIAESYVDQDARTVRTKRGKSFRTVFMPVSDRAHDIVRDWHAELSGDVTRGGDDPLFPSTAMTLDAAGCFTPTGLARYGWSTGAPIRDIFRRSFASAGLPYFNPHVRNGCDVTGQVIVEAGRKRRRSAGGTQRPNRGIEQPPRPRPSNLPLASSVLDTRPAVSPEGAVWNSPDPTSRSPRLRR